MGASLSTSCALCIACGHKLSNKLASRAEAVAHAQKVASTQPWSSASTSQCLQPNKQNLHLGHQFTMFTTQMEGMQVSVRALQEATWARLLQEKERDILLAQEIMMEDFTCQFVPNCHQLVCRQYNRPAAGSADRLCQPLS